MTKQKSPHTQSEQNTVPEQTDLETAQSDLGNEAEERAYEHMEGAETGTNRSPRRLPRSAQQHNTQPETVAHEGSVTTRTPNARLRESPSGRMKKLSASAKWSMIGRMRRLA